jgi:hypothetical protein
MLPRFSDFYKIPLSANCGPLNVSHAARHLRFTLSATLKQRTAPTVTSFGGPQNTATLAWRQMNKPWAGQRVQRKIKQSHIRARRIKQTKRHERFEAIKSHEHNISYDEFGVLETAGILQCDAA